MAHSNENDDTKIVPAIGTDSAALQREKQRPTRDETPTIIRGDDADSADSTSSSNNTRQAGLEGTRYEVVHAIGEGGMGTVYLANQVHPIKRQVAIKVVRKGPDVARFKKRFVNERQALSRLDHPHIAKFVDAGQTIGGRPYYVMEYVPGTPITHFCDYHQFDLRQRLQLFTQVCDAVAHAHTKAIIHRDLKPSNVLAYMQDDKPIVKIIDFGLAKVTQLDEESLHQTKHGAIIGSSYYMSPEQANASPDVDTRSDVYSLGVILYELLAGIRPFELSMFPRISELDFLRMVSSTAAPPPSSRLRALAEEERDSLARRRQMTSPQLAKVLAKELEWIPLKALRLEPERRYDSPNDLAEDIRRYLASEALQAGPEAWGYRVSKFLGKNRKWVGATVGAAVLMVISSAVVTVLLLISAKKQATLDEALQSSLKNQTAMADQLAHELSARLAIQMRERLKDPAFARTLPASRSVASTQALQIVSGPILAAPHDVWKIDEPPATIRTLRDLVSWCTSRARTRFSQISVPPPDSWPKPEDRRGGLPLSEGLNVLPFAEVSDDTKDVSRIILYVYCESESEFSALTASTISMLEQNGFGQVAESTASRRTFSTGTAEIGFSYPRSRSDAKWAVITIAPTGVLP